MVLLMKTKTTSIFLSLIFIVSVILIYKFITSINEESIYVANESETSGSLNTIEEITTSEEMTVETKVPIQKVTDDTSEKPDLSNLSVGAIEAYRNIVIYYVGFKQVHDNVMQFCDPMFSLVDLNGDDKPELIISIGDTHGEGCIIYGYSEEHNSIIEYNNTEWIGEWGKMDYVTMPDKTYIFSAFSSHGVSVQKVYTIENEKLKQISLFVCDNDVPSYRINNEKVDKTTYLSEYEKYFAPERCITINRENAYDVSEIELVFPTPENDHVMLTY